jgi:hypothetical protein
MNVINTQQVLAVSGGGVEMTPLEAYKNDVKIGYLAGTMSSMLFAAHLASPYGKTASVAAAVATMAILPVSGHLGGFVGAVAHHVGAQLEKATNYVFQPAA